LTSSEDRPHAEDRPLRILTVCSHNRTRSVMMAALLESMLTERLGAGAVFIRSSGFGPADLPPIDDAVDAMRRRGLDISDHRSTATTAELVDGADLVLTAERAHVVKIAALSPGAFERTMTLPEFLAATASTPVGAGDDLRSAVRSLTRRRTASGYLREQVAEIVDPTGSSPRTFEAAVALIELQCRDAASWLAARSR
jgi:protein-tyrosine phosphatase